MAVSRVRRKERKLNDSLRALQASSGRNANMFSILNECANFAHFFLRPIPHPRRCSLVSGSRKRCKCASVGYHVSRTDVVRRQLVLNFNGFVAAYLRCFLCAVAISWFVSFICF
jgi:hypothetical protein